MEHKIISACIRDRQAYEIVHQSLDPEDFTPQALEILKLVNDYYENDSEAESIDREWLVEAIKHKYKKKQVKETFLAFVENLPKVSPKNISKLVYENKLDILSNDITQELLGRRYDAADILIEKYQRLREGVDSGSTDEYTIYQGAGVEDLIESHRPENLIKVYPSTLSELIGGGLPRGDATNIIIFGPTETGKSAACVNMTYGFCFQGLRGVYIGNEDSAAKMRLRFLSRFSLMSKNEILQDPELCLSRCREKGYDNLYFVPLSPGTVKDVSKLIKKVEPQFVVVDQLKNLELGRKTEDKHPANEVSYALRAMGKANNLITVSVFQGNNDDYHRTNLTLTTSDLQGSKADIPGDADLMIGIGASDYYREQNMLRLNICKWKGDGARGYTDVRIVPEHSRLIRIM